MVLYIIDIFETVHLQSFGLHVWYVKGVPFINRRYAKGVHVAFLS